MPRAQVRQCAIGDEALSNPLQQAPLREYVEQLQMARPGRPNYGLVESSVPGAAKPGRFAPFQGAVRESPPGVHSRDLHAPFAAPEGVGELLYRPWHPPQKLHPPIEQPRWTEAGPIRPTTRFFTLRIWPWQGSYSQRYQFTEGGATVDGIHTQPPPLAFGTRGPNAIAPPNTNRLTRANVQWGSYTSTVPTLAQQVASGVSGSGLAPNATTWHYDIGYQPWQSGVAKPRG